MKDKEFLTADQFEVLTKIIAKEHLLMCSNEMQKNYYSEAMRLGKIPEYLWNPLTGIRK